MIVYNPHQSTASTAQSRLVVRQHQTPPAPARSTPSPAHLSNTYENSKPRAYPTGITDKLESHPPAKSIWTRSRCLHNLHEHAYPAALPRRGLLPGEPHTRDVGRKTGGTRKQPPRESMSLFASLDDAPGTRPKICLSSVKPGVSASIAIHFSTHTSSLHTSPTKIGQIPQNHSERH